MKINITLNEVLRDYIGQIEHIYSKYISEYNPEEVKDAKSFNLMERFNFETSTLMYDFLYNDATLEIFGHAPQKTENLMTHFNKFLVEMHDDEEHTIRIISKEFSKSIPSTLFFLSKLGCKAPEIKFVTQDVDEWYDCDVLITANPISLSEKPENKISVKINSDYNNNVNGDYEFDTLYELINNNELVEKVLTNETIK